MKKFVYTIITEENEPIKMEELVNKLKTKIEGVFEIVQDYDNKFIDWKSQNKGENQFRRTFIISALKDFTKNAIYIIMNSVKAQPLKFI